MSRCLALILSDLHLGEEDSVFMNPGANGLNQEYVEAVKKYLLERLNTTSIDYLILAGDTLDLSLARRSEAFRAFRDFLKITTDLYQKALIFLPGNHDHHLWVAIQEEALIFQRIRSEKDPKPYYHAFCPHLDLEGLRLPVKISTPFGKKTFLYHLLPEKAQKEERGFLVAYPNLYVHLSSEHQILVTHGHFFEKYWTLFTDALRKTLAKEGLRRLNFKKLEQINSPFIEFGWYSLGQAGELSRIVEKFWDEVHEGELGPTVQSVIRDLIDYLGKELLEKEIPQGGEGLKERLKGFLSHLGEEVLEAGTEVSLRVLAEIIEHVILPHLAQKGPVKGAAALRHSPKILAEEKIRKRLEDYLEMALPAFEELNTLIFGHTHVPFVNGKLEIDVSSGKREVSCFNTGGWVTDVYTPDHLSTAKPLVIALTEEQLRPIPIPWPSYEEFEQVIEGSTNEEEIRKQVKEIVWEKLS